jgi:acyl-CoA thioesterase I
MNRGWRLRPVLFLTFFCCVTALSPAIASKNNTTALPADPKQEVLALGQQWVAAENKHDTTTLERILDDKFIASFGTGKPYDKQAFIKLVTSDEVDPTESQTLTDETVLIDGDTAVVVGTDTDRGTEQGVAYTTSYRYTATYIHRHGEWAALAEHLVAAPRTDWAFLAKYRDANASLPAPARGENRVVFMGDSITEGWGMKATATSPARGEFFPGKPYVNRGISGQTSPQMLVRFRQDVIDLKPSVVVILTGTNDVAENTGKMTAQETLGNIVSMVELARASKVRTVLCSVLPASDFSWHTGLQPAPKIKALNALIKEYAAKSNLVYVDYYTPMVNSEGGLKSELSPDGVHPNAAGYTIMAPLAEAGIAAALEQPLR